jgi:Ca2+-binding RTX toxin-like protein
MQNILQITSNINQVVTTEMFGANNIFIYNRISGQGGTFDEAANLLNVSNIRFPGGTVTERNFDINNPNSGPIGFPETQRFLGITEFLEFTIATDRGVNIVLPTSRFFSGEANHVQDRPREIVTSYLSDTLKFVERLLTRGDTGADALPDSNVVSIQIGNEYWGIGLTEREYGAVVNLLAAPLQSLLDQLVGRNLPQPKILVQMADPWGKHFTLPDGFNANLSWNEKLLRANQDIINQISNPLSRAAVDGLVEHFYSRHNGSFISNTGSSFTNFINTDFAIWSAAGFGGRELHITEWNNNNNNASQYGLKGASLLIAQMEAMIRMGVDAAYAWPVQSGTTDLAGGIGQQPALTPVGAAFRLMSESIVGKRLADSNIGTGPLEVDVYVGQRETVFFVSSRSETLQNVSLNISEVFSRFGSALGVRISISDGRSVNEESAQAILTTLGQEDLIEGGGLSFSLKPFEVIRITFNDSVINNGRRDEAITGTSASEFIFGGSGNDTLEGLGGSDTLIGGTGSDIATYYNSSSAVVANLKDSSFNSGGAAGDIYFDVEGLIGSRFSDNLIGDGKSNLLFGGAGNDTLSGGGGADTIFGGEGFDWLDYRAATSSVSVNLSITTRNVTYLGVGDLLQVEGVISGDFNDTIIGSRFENDLKGGGGRDLLIGMQGQDSIFGDDAADTIHGDGGDDILFGGRGFDYIYGGIDDDVIYGGIGDDYLFGGLDEDFLAGDHGNDTIFGGDGGDTITGGLGTDYLFGGTGADIFVFTESADSGDLIFDFDANDLIAFGGQLRNQFGHLSEIGSQNFREFNTAFDRSGSDDFLIFDRADRSLWFDSDGSGPRVAQLIARFESSVILSHESFLFV